MAKRGRKKKRDRAEEIKDIRSINYRQTPDLVIKTEDDAVEFINKMGMCLLFPAEKIELPNLLQGVYGMPHPLISDSHWDEETMWTWKIKDLIPERSKAFYGKFFMEKGTFLSPDILAYLYSIKNLSPKLDNYVSLYQSGEINQAAKSIADLILDKGSVSASQIKNQLRMNTRKGGLAFQQAITTLQSNLIITNFGTEVIEGKLPSTKYELVSRIFYDEVGRSQEIMPEEARKMIIKRYMSIAVHSNEKKISKMLGWNYKIVESIFKELVNDGVIKEITIEEERGYYHSLFDSLAS